MQFSKITEVKPIGKIRTVDITVDSPNHIYYANGIATSNSHSYGYALTGYQTAWVKAHLTRHYICAWLRISKKESKPLEEIRAVISEARRLKINVAPPSIKTLPYTDFFVKKDTVHFGLDSIKNCSAKTFEKVPEIDFENCTWVEFLVKYSRFFDKRKTLSMIRCGCFDLFLMDRIKIEYEFTLWNNLSTTLMGYLEKLFDEEYPVNLLSLVNSYVEKNAKNKKNEKIFYLKHSLDNPVFSLKDSKDNLIAHEKELMGINVSCSKVTKADVPAAPNKCKDVSSDTCPPNNYVAILGEITDFHEFKVKNGKLTGQHMASFKLVDDSGDCDCVIFPQALDAYQSAMYDGNIVLISGKKSNRGGVACNEVYEV